MAKAPLILNADETIPCSSLAVSATDRVLGRSSAGGGVVEEIPFTAAGRALVDDADAAAQRTTLGLGTLATQSGTFSGTSSGVNSGDQDLSGLVVKNTSITPGTSTKTTYDAKGLVTAGAAATTADIAASTNKNYVTDAQLVVVGNTSGTNTGDQTAIPNANLATMTQKTYKGRTTASTGVPEDVAVATLKADLALAKADVGLGSVDNTSDVSKPVSTAQQAALDLKAPLASPTFTGTVVLPASTVTLAMQANMATSSLVYRKTAGSGAPEINTLATLKTDLALVKGDVGLGSVDNTSDVNKPISSATSTSINAGTSSYRTILQATGSHTAAKAAGTYAMGQGDPIAVSGTGTLYPIATIYIAAADYPTVNSLTAKLRIRAQLYTNDVAPTGNFTFGLYPITRPGTSGGAGLAIYTLGTVVSGSNGATFTTPAADGLLQAVGSDFALPADGHYVIGVVTTATIATSAHVHLVAQLQVHNA